MDPASSLISFSTRDLTAALPSIASLSGLYHDAFCCLAPYLDLASLTAVDRCCRSLHRRIAAVAPLGQCNGRFAPKDARCFPPLSSPLRLCVARFECGGLLAENCGADPLSQRLPNLTHLCFRVGGATNSDHLNAIQLAVLVHQASHPAAIAFSQWPKNLSSLEFQGAAYPYDAMLDLAALIPGVTSISLIGPWKPVPFTALDKLDRLKQLRQFEIVCEPAKTLNTTIFSPLDLETILALPNLTSLGLQRGNLAPTYLSNYWRELMCNDD